MKSQVICKDSKNYPTHLAALNELPEGPPKDVGMSMTRSHTSEGTEVDAFCLPFFFDLEGDAESAEVVSGKVYTCKFAVVATMSCDGIRNTQNKYMTALTLDVVKVASYISLSSLTDCATGIKDGYDKRDI